MRRKRHQIVSDTSSDGEVEKTDKGSSSTKPLHIVLASHAQTVILQGKVREKFIHIWLMYTNCRNWFAVTANFQQKIVHHFTTIQ